MRRPNGIAAEIRADGVISDDLDTDTDWDFVPADLTDATDTEEVPWPA